MGGYDGSCYLGLVEAYDSRENSWREVMMIIMIIVMIMMIMIRDLLIWQIEEFLYPISILSVIYHIRADAFRFFGP